MSSHRSSRIAMLGKLTLAAAASAVTGQAAVAQEAGASADQLEEVIVTTARQRAESLQDVPATVTAITADTLEAAAVRRAGDFVRLTPGVSLVQTAEVADAQVNIRGINGARDAENSFALIVDGILQTNPAAFNREYADLQQIEILKGPQGALYGRNAAAGAIIVTTTKPTDEFSGQAKVGFGEDSTTTGALVLSGPLGGSAGWKVSADYRDTDGFYRNTFAGTPAAPSGLGRYTVDDFEGWNVTARFVFEPSDATSIDVKAHYGEVDAASISFNAAFQLPAFTGAPLPNAALFDEDVNTHQFDFVTNLDPFNEQDALDFSIKLDQELGFGTLTAWGLYSDIENNLGSDGTSGAFGFFFADAECINTSAAVFNSGFQLPPPQIQFGPEPQAAIFGPYTAVACDGTQYQERNQEDFSFEVRLTSRSDQRLRWQIGAYYLDIDREVGVNTGIDRGQGIVKSLFAPAGSANPTEALLWDNFTSEIYAGFGNVAFDVTDALELAVAVRYDEEQRKVRSLVPTDARTQYIDFDPFDGLFTGNAPLNPALNPAINPSGVIPDREETWDEVQPKVSLTWKPSTELTAYANWGVGFKSGGFNNSGSAATVDLFINCFTGRGPAGELNTCSLADPVPDYRSVIVNDTFEKETSSAAEIGIKWQSADRRYGVDASVFKTDVDDMQFFEFLVGQFGLLRVVNNIDEVELEGFEIGATARVTDDLRFVAGYSRVDSEITANTSRPNSVGNKSPYTPDYTATVGLELDSPVGSGDWRVQASAFWSLVGPTWFHVIQAQDNQTIQAGGFVPGNYTNTERDEYDTIDARFGVASDNWTLAFIGRNILDEKYLQEVIPAVEFGGSFIHPGSERRWSVEVGYRF